MHRSTASFDSPALGSDVCFVTPMTIEALDMVIKEPFLWYHSGPSSSHRRVVRGAVVRHDAALQLVEGRRHGGGHHPWPSAWSPERMECGWSAGIGAPGAGGYKEEGKLGLGGGGGFQGRGET